MIASAAAPKRPASRNESASRFPAFAESRRIQLEPDPLPRSPRIELKNLFRIAETQDQIPWLPFRDGIDIHRLYGDGITGSSAALLRFRKAGIVPRHEHTGFEHILVLAGSQRDDNGTAGAGTLIISPPGTSHSVVSEAGCIVLAIYERPVKFLAEGGTGTPRG